MFLSFQDGDLLFENCEGSWTSFSLRRAQVISSTTVMQVVFNTNCSMKSKVYSRNITVHNSYIQASLLLNFIRIIQVTAARFIDAFKQ